MAYDPLDPDADCFKPPDIPTEVWCLHCGQEYESYLIEWRVREDAEGRKHGFWCCATPGCGGAGFGFDIFPTDPEHEANEGWSFDEDEEDEEDQEHEGEAFDGGFTPSADRTGDADNPPPPNRSTDPSDEAESPRKYTFGDEDDIPF